MKFTDTITVIGMKRAKGEFKDRESGNPVKYDNTTVYCLVSLNTADGNAVGQMVESYKLGTSMNFERFNTLDYPFQADASFMVTSTGRSTKTELIDLVPVKQTAKAKASAA